MAEANAQERQSAVNVLNNPEIIRLAETGRLTVAMVRPNVGPDANVRFMDDITAAETIEQKIFNLGVVAKFSIRFTDQLIEEFYEGPSKENMKRNPSRLNSDFDSTWSEFKDLMTSGPCTVLLLHKPDDAITEWRDHLGHWNIEKFRDPNTIRGRLGVSNYNNLVHGSDAPESVVRELGLIAQVLKQS